MFLEHARDVGMHGLVVTNSMSSLCSAGNVQIQCRIVPRGAVRALLANSVYLCDGMNLPFAGRRRVVGYYWLPPVRA